MEIFILYLISGILGIGIVQRLAKGLNFYEVVLLSLFLGPLIHALFMVPFVLFGVFSLWAVLIATLAYVAISLFLLRLPNEWKKPNLALAVALIAAILSFVLHLESRSPAYFELDPYFYMKAATMLFERGYIPQDAHLGWYPHQDNSYFNVRYKVIPLAWPLFFLNHNDPYFIAYNLAPFSPYFVSFIPVFLYFIFKRDWRVLLGAVMLFFSFPNLMLKGMAGVTELFPLGIAMIVLIMALFVRQENHLLALSAFLMHFFTNVYYPLAILLLPVLIYSFFKPEFRTVLFYFGLGMLSSVLVYALIDWQGIGFLKSPMLFLSLAYVLPKLAQDKGVDKYLPYVIYASPLLLLTPLASVLNSVASTLGYKYALQRTIAEQTTISSNLAGYLGLIGIPVKLLELVHLPIEALFIIGDAILKILFKNVQLIPPQPSLFSVLVLLSPVLLIKSNQPQRLIFLLVLPMILAGMTKAKLGIFLSLGALLLIPAEAIAIDRLLKASYGVYGLLILAAMNLFHYTSVFQILLQGMETPYLDYNGNLTAFRLECYNKFGQTPELYSLRCMMIPMYWTDLFDWAAHNPRGIYMTWWDYGHWLNFFVNMPAVLRNEHKDKTMIGHVAYLYVMGTPSDWQAAIRKYNISYVVVDNEIIGTPDALGKKFFALNYLACDYANKTNVDQPQMKSACEHKNLWEMVFVSDAPQSCVISQQLGETGIQGMWLYYNETRDVCIGKDGKVYWMKRDNAGDLEFSGAIAVRQQVRYNGMITYALFYSDPNRAVSRFYRSLLYRAFYLNQVPGMQLVYKNRGLVVFKV